MSRVCSRILWLYFVVFALLSCADDHKSVTALVVVIDSNIDLKDIDSVHVRVMGFSDQTTATANLDDGKMRFPRTLGLVHRGGPLGPITVIAEARNNGSVVVVQRLARVSFVQDKILMLRLNLLAQCIDVPCDPGETCGDSGTCRDEVVKASELKPWTGKVPDIKLDVVTGDDAGVDSGMDGGPASDAGDADTGVEADAGMSMFDAGELPLMCAPHFKDCDDDRANGCENLLTDKDNCGACDVACPAVGSKNISGSACMSGKCKISCDEMPYADCDSKISNGCESDLMNSSLHCGDCGTACPAHGFMHVDTSMCTGGSCAITCDDVDYDDCDSMAATGCETDLRITALHCGSCDTKCPDVTDSTLNISGSDCESAACKITCNTHFDDCDDMLGTGCEADLREMDHCGDCDTVCPALADTASHVTASECMDDACKFTCDAPNFDDCDTQGDNGCETDLRDSFENCGGCNQACPVVDTATHIAASVCETSACKVTCEDDFDDCTAAPGCETNLTNTFDHCGDCGTTCPAISVPENHVTASVCSNSLCAITCQTGWADFDNNPLNGCETASPLFSYTPSNFDATASALALAKRAAAVINCNVTFDTGTTGAIAAQTWCGVTVNPFATTQIVVIPLSSLTVASGSTLTLTGQRPVIFAVFGSVSIAGKIDASAVGATSGAGGNVSCGTSAGGAGANGGGNGGGGGGGGGFTTAGAVGGDGGHTPTTPVAGIAGVLRTSAALSPLIAGCPGGKGGDGDSTGGSGGGAGGAFQISATGSVSLAATAVLAAAGGGGRVSTSQESGGGGGGSGGAILLEGAPVTTTAGGWLTANGGGGAEGNGNSSSTGVSGANGDSSSAVAAVGGSGGEANGGNGGNGGIQGTAPKVGGAGATPCNLFCGDANDNGGGGGGGSVGRIHIRSVGACTLSASFSPTATSSCN